MAKMDKKVRDFAKIVHDANTVLKQVTGKSIPDYVNEAWALWGRAAIDWLRSLPTPEEERDPDDLADCQLLGADNFYSYKVFKFAVRAYREENHPDKFPPEKRLEQEEKFKQGEQAISRICERRGWRL